MTVWQVSIQAMVKQSVVVFYSSRSATFLFQPFAQKSLCIMFSFSLFCDFEAVLGKTGD